MKGKKKENKKKNTKKKCTKRNPEPPCEEGYEKGGSSRLKPDCCYKKKKSPKKVKKKKSPKKKAVKKTSPKKVKKKKSPKKKTVKKVKKKKSPKKKTVKKTSPKKVKKKKKSKSKKKDELILKYCEDYTNNQKEIKKIKGKMDNIQTEMDKLKKIFNNKKEEINSYSGNDSVIIESNREYMEAYEIDLNNSLGEYNNKYNELNKKLKDLTEDSVKILDECRSEYKNLEEIVHKLKNFEELYKKDFRLKHKISFLIRSLTHNKNIQNELKQKLNEKKSGGGLIKSKKEKEEIKNIFTIFDQEENSFVKEFSKWGNSTGSTSSDYYYRYGKKTKNITWNTGKLAQPIWLNRQTGLTHSILFNKNGTPKQISNPMSALLTNAYDHQARISKQKWKDENGRKPYSPPLWNFFDNEYQGGLYSNTKEEDKEVKELCKKIPPKNKIRAQWTYAFNNTEKCNYIDSIIHNYPLLESKIKAFKFIVDTIRSYKVTDPKKMFRKKSYTGNNALNFVFNKLKFTEGGDGRNTTILEYLIDGKEENEEIWTDICKSRRPDRILNIYAYTYVKSLLGFKHHKNF